MKSTAPADSTRCVHAGEDCHGRNSSITTDIAQASVFTLASVDELRRYNSGARDLYVYSRYGNPTVRAAERKIAALEGGEDCVVTSSGMAAEHAIVLALCRSGDEIVSMQDIYGGTSKLFKNLFPRLGIRTRMVPFSDLSRIARQFTKKTKLLFLETPTNPALRCVDIAALAEEAQRRGVTVVVDNTFATPILQKPLEHGADIVIHSATKYLGGHSDLTAGAVVAGAKHIAAIRDVVIQTGCNSDALIAWLLLRGLKTLGLRVERACLNAFHVADFLHGHARVERVLYPGIVGSEFHELALRQMRDFGMMVSFDIKGGGKAAERFIDALKLWYLATSLGGVESTVSYPVLASHVSCTKAELAQLGVSAATVRLSVGIEDSRDLIADLEQALQRSRASR